GLGMGAQAGRSPRRRTYTPGHGSSRGAPRIRGRTPASSAGIQTGGPGSAFAAPGVRLEANSKPLARARRASQDCPCWVGGLVLAPGSGRGGAPSRAGGRNAPVARREEADQVGALLFVNPSTPPLLGATTLRHSARSFRLIQGSMMNLQEA